MHPKWLERALVFTLLAHLAASAAMGLLLLPGMPGGPNAEFLARAAHIAAHPLRWRVGFFFWHLVSLSDLFLTVVLVMRGWRQARGPALCAVLGTLVALAFEQPCEVLWETRMVDLARTAVATGDAGAFAQLETRLYVLTAAWSTWGWTLAAIGWSWMLARLALWTRGLTRLSWVLWGLFGVVGLAPLLPSTWVPSAGVVALNVIGFALMAAWMAWVTEVVLWARRPSCVVGHWLPWRYPERGWMGGLLDGLANSRLLRWLGDCMPVIALQSDIRDVIYINHLVKAERLTPLVPAGLELDRIGPEGQWAVCSCLAFRHGAYGPRWLGPFRRWVAWSPLQANWRVHVRVPGSGERGILFLATTVTRLPYALAARWLAEGVSMHMPEVASHVRESPGTWCGRWSAGSGSSPDLSFSLTAAAEVPLPEPWHACFGSRSVMLAYIVPQEQTFVKHPDRLLRQSIRLQVDVAAAIPLEGSAHSAWMATWVAGSEALCFAFERVGFAFAGETRVTP